MASLQQPMLPDLLPKHSMNVPIRTLFSGLTREGSAAVHAKQLGQGKGQEAQKAIRLQAEAERFRCP